MKIYGKIFLLVPLIMTACHSDKKDIYPIQKYTDISYSDMVNELGPPVDKTAYKIKNASTKSWNHDELFSRYPKCPENKDIQIMEIVWDAGEYSLFACFHMVDDTNRCLVAKKIRKGVKF